MKRTLLALVCLGVSVSLTGCGTDETTAPVAAPSETYSLPPLFPDDAETGEKKDTPAEPDEQQTGKTSDKQHKQAKGHQGTSTGGPVTVVTTWANAWGQGSSKKACSLMTDGFRTQVVTGARPLAKALDVDPTTLTCESAIAAMNQTLANQGRRFEIGDVALASAKGKTARVFATFAKDAAPQELTLTKTKGRWLIEATSGTETPQDPSAPDTQEKRDKRDAASKKTTAHGTDHTSHTRPPRSRHHATGHHTAPTPPKKTAPTPAPAPEPVAVHASGLDRWLPNWCSLDPGMTRSEAERFMGSPTEVLTDSAYPQIGWAKREYDFTAFLRGGKVWQLQADYSALTKAQRDRLTCPAVRD